MGRLSSLGLSPGLHSPALYSPALSVSSVLRPQSSTFTGQSPALSYRPIPVPETVIIQLNSTQQHLPGSQLQSSLDGQPTVLMEYRYRQEDEERIGKELSLCETQFGEQHSKTLHQLQELGRVLLDQGRYRSAEDTIRKLVMRSQRQYGNDHSRTLGALELLGNVLYYEGLYDKAEKLYLRIFKAKRKVLGWEHPDTLATVTNLEWLYLSQGRWNEVEELHV